MAILAGACWFVRHDGSSASPGKPAADALFVAGADLGYVDPSACQGCHQQIWDTYQKTGMGRSFDQPRPSNTVENYTDRNSYFHEPSDRHYQMVQRGGKYYQRRYQIGFDGQETNVVEKEIHYVMGSGNHARSYLHRTASGKLVQLPLGWYPEGGGQWAMSPGYDKPNHQGFQRTVGYDCMGCHNGYPEIEPNADLPGQSPRFPGMIPEGIDCQRCHGPGREHIAVFEDDDPPIERIRATITNPARLSADRQIEVCLQCHLESTSRKLPNVVHRYDRGLFSFRPGEALADWILHFDHEPGRGYDDKFEINHAGHRLLESACFQKSGGALTCTTCHDAHDVPRGEDAAMHYQAVCRECHSEAFDQLVARGGHTAAADCLDCHMPKRRTQDVVHAVMTDHLIQRQRPARDLVAPLREDNDTVYKGAVALLYPSEATRESDELYIALAQVQQGANLEEGVPRLRAAIDRYRPEEEHFYYELAEGYRGLDQFTDAIAMYEEAVRRNAGFVLARQRLASALAAAGEGAQAEQELLEARSSAPEDVFVARDLALLYGETGRFEDSLRTTTAALALDPDLPELHNNRGTALANLGRLDEARQAYREAIRLQPDLAEARTNLAGILASEGAIDEARFQLEKALASDESSATTHLLLGNVLEMQEEAAAALAHYGKAVALAPESVVGRMSLASALAGLGRFRDAEAQLARIIDLQPDRFDARLLLAQVLAAQGKLTDSAHHARAAEYSPDPEIQGAARELLKQLGQ